MSKRGQAFASPSIFPPGGPAVGLSGVAGYFTAAFEAIDELSTGNDVIWEFS